jgi:glycosyltransferase involved in cell wall biosynthesis
MIAYTNYLIDSRVRREAEALAARGDEVDVICVGLNGSPRQECVSGVKLEKIFVSRYQGSNIFRYLFIYLLFFGAALRRVTWMHLKKRYHVIQVHTMPDFLVFAALIPKWMGAKIILDIHDLMPELYKSKFGVPMNHPLIRLITRIERASIRFADRAFAVHKPHLDALVEHGNPEEKFIQILNLADEKIFTREGSQEINGHEPVHFIYHGTVAYRHGLELAIRAFDRLKNNLTDFRFEIFGNGEDIDRIIQIARDLNLQDKILIRKGNVPMLELIPRIKRADIGIVPFLLDDFTRFMLPVKLMEYVALGIPAICTRSTTIETYFSDEMVAYFPSGDVDALAERILELAQNPERRKKIVQKADKFLEEYNWQTQKKSYYQLIDSLLETN